GDGALEDILRIAKKVVRAVKRRLEPIEPVVRCKQVCNQRRRLFWLVILHIKQRAELLKCVLSTLEDFDFHALPVHLYEVTAGQSEGVDRDERNGFPLARPRERNGAEVSGFAVIDRWNCYRAGAAPAAQLCAMTLSMALSARFPHSI